jgi:hypothetical protein
VTVLMPNARLTVRRRTQGTRDAYGQRVNAGWGPLGAFHDGRTNETADATWNLGIDPALWPIRRDDLIISESGGSWLVQTADLIRNNLDSYVDWVRVTAQHRSNGFTEPGGAWFVGRYDDYVEPPPVDPPPPPSKNAAGMWIGYGPPPEVSDDFWPQVGDEYLDLYTGMIYTLGEGP